MNDLILYTTEDGRSRIQLRADQNTVWLTQLELAELFDATKQNISLHLKNIFEDGELEPSATVKESLTVQIEGAREVRKQDILIAKNYLTEDEIDTLNRLVVIFLETAELRAKNRQETRMSFWKQNVDQIITSNGFPLLSHAGSVSHEQMKKHTSALYLEYDQQRKIEEAKEADLQDDAELKALEAMVKKRKQ